MLNYSIYEDGNGGDLWVKNNRIQYTRALYVACYLRMFGGNTTSQLPDGHIKSWWGNDINKPNEWVNSNTERVLLGMTITPRNTLLLEEAVKKDLKSLEKYGTISVQILLPLLNRVTIRITIEKSEKNSFDVVWDATSKEVIEYRN
jgi:hypothetical protein